MSGGSETGMEYVFFCKECGLKENVLALPSTKNKNRIKEEGTIFALYWGEEIKRGYITVLPGEEFKDKMTEAHAKSCPGNVTKRRA